MTIGAGPVFGTGLCFIEVKPQGLKGCRRRMNNLVTFLEGMLSFISPCMLPLLPLYISYFAGGKDAAAEGSASEQSEKRLKIRVFLRVLCFICGFTVLFTLMGVFAGTIGMFLARYSRIVHIVCGAVIIFFGLVYLDVIKIGFFRHTGTYKMTGSLISAFVFGLVYAVNLTPCIGAFLGAALMMAASQGSAAAGALLLVVYSLGLGIPFAISAWILDSLRGAFDVIKKHYGVINKIAGGFLIAVGILMIFGVMNRVMGLLVR